MGRPGVPGAEEIGTTKDEGSGTMPGLSLSQFEKLTRLGVKIDGRKVLVEGEARPTDDKPLRAYYVVELPNQYHDDLWLVPVAGDGSVARSGFDRQNYAYTHGGRTFRAACEAAWELASALAFPHAD
jgi:hypothetical protein